MRSMLLRVFVVLSLLCLAQVALGQGVGYSGVLTGVVTDAQGATVNNAQVTITQPDKGIQRTATTDKDGYYRVGGLPPANYTVKVEAPGMSPQTHSNVPVTVGKVANADFHLSLGTVKTEVVVTSELPPVETERAGQADTIGQRYIEELPIDRRDYLTYTLLSPGVSDSTRLADNADFRVKQTPQSGLSFYGSNGRGNSIIVDGSEANDDAGGVRLTVSQDAVQEFQINRSNYGVELGGASGASINIVTKSGTNAFHGSGYGFFRTDALDAQSPFSFTSALQPGDPFSLTAKGTPVKDALSRQQFGVTIGGPIRKDKTFFFISYEGLRRSSDQSVPLLTDSSIFAPTSGERAVITGLATLAGNPPVPCLTGQPALPAATCAAILTNILTINPAASPRNAFIVNQFEANSGLFPFTGSADYGLVRLDHQFSPKNQIHIRYNGARDDESNPGLQALTGFSRSDSLSQLDHTIQGAWIHIFTPAVTNELRLQYNHSLLDVTPNFPGQVGLDVPGFGTFGSNIFLPNFTTMNRYEFADNVTWTKGHHTMKFGVSELLRDNNTDSATFFAGRFVFGNLPGGILSPCLQVPAACGLVGVNATTLSSLNSISLGLPQFYQQGFGDRPKDGVVSSINPFFAVYGQDSWNVRPNFTLNLGLRWELDSRYEPLHTAHTNFAPRVSFSWDPWNDHKTVIRGGYGVFFAPINYQIDYVVRALGNLNGNRQIAQVFVPLTGQPGNPALTSAAIFQTLFAQGKIQCPGTALGSPACITPADLAQFGIAITHTGPNPPLTVLFSGDPNFQNAYSQQAELGIERELWAGWTISGTYIHSHTVHITRARDKNLLPTPTNNWGTPACKANPFLCFVNPLLLQDNIYESKGGAMYDAGILEVRKAFSHHFSMVANYTYSKAFDDVTDYNSDFEPFIQTTLQGERSLSDFDQRHKFILYMVAESPWKQSDDGAFRKIFANFTVAPEFSAHSGHPFNILAGSDINGDRHSTNDRPFGLARNAGQGPDFVEFNLRIARRFPITERANVQFVFEAFNLFNRTNYSSVNNTLTDLSAPLPSSLEGNPHLTPSQTFGFTSAFEKRELQLGVRISF